jgi:hypothetical protein
LVDFHEVGREVMPFKGDSMQKLFNPIASTTLKLLRFKVQIFSLAQQYFGTVIVKLN